jgi:hypothetical protein
MTSQYVVELPKDLRSFLESQAKRRGFPTPAAYVEALVYAAADVPDDAVLADKLLEGLASPRRIEATRSYWSAKRRSLVGRKRTRPRR